jgi:hypothetical protein
LRSNRCALTLALQHLDRNTKFLSPYVGCSNVLVWSIVNAHRKKLDSGNNNVSWAIIDRQQFSKHHIFHAKSYREAPANQHLFSYGGHRCPAISEFLVWRTIPKRAILHTITIDKLCQEIKNDPDMKRIFRLEKLLHKRMPKGRPTLRQDLQADHIPLSSGSGEDTVSGIAKFLLLIGVGSYSSGIRHIVSDIIHGFCIQPQKGSPEGWFALSEHFLNALTLYGSLALSHFDRDKARIAFLQGVQFGFASPNIAHKETKKLQKKWAKVGLSSLQPILNCEMKLMAARHQELLIHNQAVHQQLERHRQSLESVTAARVRAIAPRFMPAERSRYFLQPGLALPDDEVDSDMEDDSADNDSEDDSDVAYDWRDNLVEQM